MLAICAHHFKTNILKRLSSGILVVHISAMHNNINKNAKLSISARFLTLLGLARLKGINWTKQLDIIQDCTRFYQSTTLFCLLRDWYFKLFSFFKALFNVLLKRKIDKKGVNFFWNVDNNKDEWASYSMKEKHIFSKGTFIHFY